VTGGTTVTGPDLVAITRVATGRHAGYDRFVVEFANGPVPRFEVVPQDDPRFVRDGSGEEITLEGDAGVSIALRDVDVTTVVPRSVDASPGLPAIREVALVGAFEGVVSFGLGVDGDAAVKVTTLTGPSRLVVDVRHPS
jgi:hypothetical protein